MFLWYYFKTQYHKPTLQEYYIQRFTSCTVLYPYSTTSLQSEFNIQYYKPTLSQSYMQIDWLEPQCYIPTVLNSPNNTPTTLLPHINAKYIHPIQYSYNPTPTYEYWIHTPHTNTPTILLQHVIAPYADPTPTLLQSYTHIIQIKICAEYRDMLPRPRLVCQEPGLRPIGRSPGIPDKSSRGLGSMSRYSAQILICFIAYIFSIFNFSVGLVGNLAELPPCTVPPATVHCYQNEAAQCSSDNQISQHALLRGSRKKHSLAFMPQNWWN